MRVSDHWRGHLLLFDLKARPSYPARAGLRLLLCFLFLEAVLGPRFHLLDVLGVQQPPAWIRVAVLLVLALALVRFVAGLKLSAIGLLPWREWSATEKSYFVQVVVIANVVFAVIFGGHFAGAAAAMNFAWGFYQELAYRGMLQTELTQRFGSTAGILGANLAYTFGPLHFYHFGGSSPVAMFAAIFAIGLLFGVLRHRSGNLWLPAVFHGIGTAWILGPAGG